MATNALSNVVTGSITCNGTDTVYLLNSTKLAVAAGGEVSGSAPLTAQGPNQGWNQLTLAVSGITGGKTWYVQALVGDTAFRVTDDLPVSAVVTLGGPQPGAFDPTGPTFTPVPAFRSAAYNVVLSAADSAGRIKFTMEARSL